MAEEAAEPAHVLRRPKRRRQQSIRRQLLEPPTIEAIRFWASRHVLDVAGIDQGDRQPAGRAELPHWHPVHARGFPSHRSDMTGREPVS